MNGVCYVFLRKDGAPLPPGNAGHVGWGFLLNPQETQSPGAASHTTFYCGSTENRSGSPVIPPGGDNSWWGEVAASEEQMIAEFRARNYDCYKVSAVRNCDSVKGRETADATREWGYTGLGNNCLDHVWKILSAFGDAGLPFAQTHPAPNDWFAVYNGEFHNIVR